MVESNFDTVKIVYVCFTIVVDILVHLALWLIVKKGPKSENTAMTNKNIVATHQRLLSTVNEDEDTDNQSNQNIINNNDEKNTEISDNQSTIEINNEPWQTKAYEYLFTANYPIINNTDIENTIFENTNETNSNWFVDTTPMKIFSDCTCYKYLKYSLQLWAFCCGFLAIYLSLVFWMNLFAEFVFAAIGRSDESPGSIFGLVAVYFMVEIIFFCLKRQIESIIVLTRNIGDVFAVKIILFWRIYDVILIILCTGCSRINSSTWFFQILMLLMVIRGMIWQIVHGLIVFFLTIGIVIYQFSLQLDGLKKPNEWVNWKEFIFVINDRPEKMSQCNWYKYAYIIIIWLLIIIFFAMIPIYKELFAFSAIIMIIYYLIILFDIGKYNVWYSLWTGKYHSQYFGYQNINYTKQQRDDIELVVATHKQYQKVSITEEEETKQQNEYDYKTVETDSIATTVLTVPNDDMVFMDYWERIRYKHNHYMCSCCWCLNCDKCPPTTEDTMICCGDFGISLLKWICIIFFVIVILLTVNAWLQPEPAVTNPPTFTNNNVAPYEVCNTAWANNNITIVDLIYLVKASSFIKWDGLIENEQITKQFDIWFGNQSVSGWNYSSLYIHPQPGFFHITNNKQQIDVLINRPTATNMDLIQNIRLYGEATLFHVFSFAIPLSSLLPISFIREFIVFASIPESLLSPTLHDEYDNVVYNYVISNISGRTNSKYFIQGGHSLGGGLTDIVGGRLYHNGYGDNSQNFSIINFGLGSPGTVWSSKKFGYNVEDIDKSTSIHLKARRDLVSTLVDIHGGAEQQIRCIQPDPLACHYSTNYFCEMYRSCNAINTQTGQNMFRNKTFTKCVCEEQFNFDVCW